MLGERSMGLVETCPEKPTTASEQPKASELPLDRSQS